MSLHCRIHDPSGPRRLRMSCAAKRGAPAAHRWRRRRRADDPAGGGGGGVGRARRAAAAPARRSPPPPATAAAPPPCRSRRGAIRRSRRRWRGSAAPPPSPTAGRGDARRRPSAGARARGRTGRDRGHRARRFRRAPCPRRSSKRARLCAASPSTNPVAAARWASLGAAISCSAPREARRPSVVSIGSMPSGSKPASPSRTTGFSRARRRWRNCSSILFKPLETQRNPAKWQDPAVLLFPICSNVLQGLWPVKPQGIGGCRARDAERWSDPRPSSARPRGVSASSDACMLLPFSKRTRPSEIASSQIDRCGQLRRQASASA